MKIVKDNSKSNAGVDLEEFTNAEITSLFPNSDLLHKIQNDHVYTSTDYKLDDSQEIDDSSDDNSHHEDDILSLNADSIQQVFQRMVDMTSLDVITDQTEENPQEVNTDFNDETSTQRKSTIRKVKFVDELPGTSVDDKSANHERKAERAVTRGFKKDVYFSGRSTKNDKVNKALIENEPKDEPIDRSRLRSKKQGSKQKGKRTTKSSETQLCKSVSNNEWKTVNRCAEVERELNTLIQYTAELLVRRWGEYLMMTTEQISKYEIENAKQHKMIEEVVEMLEDKDRYVWQLIDELRFF